MTAVIAILGAGPIGAALAHRLAERGRVSGVRLIDANLGVAQGKALDIRQSGPIEGSDVPVSGATDPLDAVSADVIVLADDTSTGAWDGDRGLALLDRLSRAGVTAPFVFAAPTQTSLIEAAARELHIATNRLIGTAASAVESIAASLVNIETGQTGASVAVTGRPASFVVAWSSATIGGALVSERVAAHRLLAISQALPRLWPPGPQAIAAPTALVVEALVSGSRRPLPALTILDGEFGVRGRAGLLPVVFGNGRILSRQLPSLSPVEKTETSTVLLKAN